MAERTNFYAVLGLDHSADERAVKKAYFALVRKHPPETDPDAFQRIREAYEVLSNPRSRADYDAVEQFDRYGTEAAARLHAATEALDCADWARAEVELTAVLAVQPRLAFARDLLGMAYLNAHRTADALREFARLVEEQPGNAVYHLHHGYAWYAQGQYERAVDCYREARRLDPNDARALVATADCLVAQKQYELALEELDRAIHLDGTVDFQDFVFFIRKVQIQLLRERGDLAEHELDQIFAVLPDDPETRRYVATRLAALASDLFAMKRSVDANRLLARCRTLDPTRKSMEYTFPARTRLAIAALPEPSQRWLAAQARATTPLKLTHGAKAGRVALLLLALAAQALALHLGFATEHVWDGTERLLAFLGLMGTPLFLVVALRGAVQVWQSPYGKYTIVHPCHVLQVELDAITVWPLVNLHDVALTHHSNNGVYQYTLCRLSFAGALCDVVVRGQARAVDWANRVLEQRRKVLDLMSAGLLEAEEGFDLVPPSLLVAGGAEAGARASGAVGAGAAVSAGTATGRGERGWYGAGAAAGALLFALALPMNVGAGERHAWATAARLGSPVAYGDYLGAFPDGKHAAEARAARVAGYARAIARYQAGDGARAPASAAVVAMLRILGGSDGGAVRVRYEGRVAFEAVGAVGAGGGGRAAAAGGCAVDPSPAFGDAQNRMRQRALTSRLRESVAQLVGEDVVDFDDGGTSYSYDEVNQRLRARRFAPVSVVVRYTITRGPGVGVDGADAGCPARLHGELALIDAGGAALYSTRLMIDPPSRRRTMVADDDRAQGYYGEQAEALFHAFGVVLARQVGATVGPALMTD
jgi:curved DNA-binding protein CbpA